MAISAAVAPRFAQAVSLRLDLAEVMSGVSTDAVDLFVAESGLALTDVFEVVISARAMRQRRAKHQMLSLDESDRLARLVRIYNHAVAVFGEAQKAVDWLSSPNRQIRQQAPIRFLRTEVGGRSVDEMLWQIADGMFV